MAGPYVTGQAPFDNSIVAGFLEYASPSNPQHQAIHMKKLPLLKPTLPDRYDTTFVTSFTSKLLSLATGQLPANVQQKIDKNFLFTTGLGTLPCDNHNQPCQGPNGAKYAASVNNFSFVEHVMGPHGFAPSTFQRSAERCI